jgi:hypothetical protein
LLANPSLLARRLRLPMVKVRVLRDRAVVPLAGVAAAVAVVLDALLAAVALA